jgi:hypothetical protein
LFIGLALEQFDVQTEKLKSWLYAVEQKKYTYYQIKSEKNA